MSRDFQAKQLRTSKIIASGGIGEQKAKGSFGREHTRHLGLVIYSGSVAGDYDGNIASTMLENVGHDVYFFISGSKTPTKGYQTKEDLTRHPSEPYPYDPAVVLFGGDVVVSGTLYAERTIAEVDSTVDGDFYITGTLFLDGDNATDAVLQMHKDAVDYFSITTTTNGATTLATVDAAAIAADLTLDADGDIILDAAGSQIYFKEAGTTFALLAEIGDDAYFNFGATVGTSGYGFMDDAGVLRWKNSGGSWEEFNATNALNDLSDVTYSSGDLTITSLDTIIAGALTIDSSGDIALSADGGNVTMDDGTVTVFDFDTDNCVFTLYDDADTDGDRDYFKVAVGAAGATTITTNDDGGAAANLTITADGTAELAGTTVTLNSAADIILDAAGHDIFFKDDGTTRGSLDLSVANMLIFKDVGATEIFRIDGAADSLLMASTKKIEFTDGNAYIHHDGTDLKIADDADINLVAGADILLDAAGDIILDSVGNAIYFKQNGAIRGLLDTSTANMLIFRDVQATEIFRIDGVDDALLMASSKKLAFNTVNSYIQHDGTDLKIADNADINLVAGVDILLDAAGDIILDADGNDIHLKDAGADFGKFYNSSGNLLISGSGAADDTDIIFMVGHDSVSSEIARFDGSRNSFHMNSTRKITFYNDNAYIHNDGTDLKLYDDSDINLVAGVDILLDAGGDIILDAAGDDIYLKGSSGNEFGKISKSSNALIISGSAASDSTDIIFKVAVDSVSTEIVRLHGDQNAFTVNDGSTLKVGNAGASMWGNLGFGLNITGSYFNVMTNIGDVKIGAVTDIQLHTAGGNIEFFDNDVKQLSFDMDSTANEVHVLLGVDSDDLVFKQFDGHEVIRIADDRKLYFYDKGGEHISGNGSYLTIAGDNVGIDSAGFVNIDAGTAGTVTFKDDGTSFLELKKASNDAIIRSTINTGDVIFQDYDEDEIFISKAGVGLFLPGSNRIRFRDTAAYIHHDGSDIKIADDHGINLVSGGTILLDAESDIWFDSNSGQWSFKDNGTEIFGFSNVSGDVYIYNSTQDKDILFFGNDGGNSTTCLGYFDTSAGGKLYSHSLAVTGTNGVTTTLTGNELDISSGDFTIDAAGAVVIDSAKNAANAIYLHVDGGTGETIKIHADQSEAIAEDGAAIQLTSDVGGIGFTAHGGTIGIQGNGTGGNPAFRFTSDASSMYIDIKGEFHVDAGLYSGAAGWNLFGTAASSLNTTTGAITIDGENGVTIKENGTALIIIDDDRDVTIGTSGGSYADPDVTLSGYTKVVAGFHAAGGVIFNEDGDDVDFRVEGKNSSAAFVVDGETDSIMMGTAGNYNNIPLATLHIRQDQDTSATPGGKNSSILIEHQNSTLSSSIRFGEYSTSTHVTTILNEIISDVDHHLVLSASAQDTDIIFKVNDGGTSAEVARFDGSASSFLVAGTKKIEFGSAAAYIHHDGTDLKIADDADINLFAGVDILLDAAGDIYLDAAGEQIFFYSDGDKNGSLDLSSTDDIIFKDASNTEIFRIDGSEDSLLMAGPNKIQFASVNSYIRHDGTDLHLYDDADIDLEAGVDIRLDAGGDIHLDAGGSNINFQEGGVTFASINEDGDDAYLNFGTTAGTSGYGIVDDAGVLKWKNSGGSWAIFGGGGGSSALDDLSDVSYSSGDLTITSLDTIIAASLTIDSAGAITLDSDNATWSFRDDGTEIFQFTHASSDVILASAVSDKDIKFIGNDNGNTAVVMGYFDASAGGTLYTHSLVVSGTSGVTTTLAGNELDVSSGDLTLDVAGDIHLDAAGSNINFKEAGTTFASINEDGDDAYFNFGTTAGTSGYGIQDDAGTLKWKNSGGSWATFGAGGGASALDDLSDVTYSSGDLTITSLDTIIAGALTIDSSGTITLDSTTLGITNLAKDGTNYLSFATGGGQATLYTSVNDEDIVFKTKTGGNNHESFRIIGNTESLRMRLQNKIEFTDANAYIHHDGTDLHLYDDADIDLEAGVDIRLDAGGDITLDADGGSVIFKDGGTEISRRKMGIATHSMSNNDTSTSTIDTFSVASFKMAKYHISGKPTNTNDRFAVELLVTADIASNSNAPLVAETRVNSNYDAKAASGDYMSSANLPITVTKSGTTVTVALKSTTVFYANTSDGSNDGEVAVSFERTTIS